MNNLDKIGTEEEQLLYETPPQTHDTNVQQTQPINTQQALQTGQESVIGTLDGFWHNHQQENGGKQNFYTITDPNQTQEIEFNRQLFYTRLAEHGIDLEDLKPILEGEGHKLIIACAGAGKSTAVVLLKLYNQVTGRDLKPFYYQDANEQWFMYYVQKRSLISTFLSSGALDIESVYTDWAQKLGVGLGGRSNIKFSTLHAEVRRALVEMGMKPNILENSVVQEILTSVMMSLGIRNRNSFSSKPTRDEVRDFEGIVGYTRNMLNEKRYMHQLMVDYNLDSVTLDRALEMFKSQKKSLGLDFEDLQEELLMGLQMNQAVVDFIHNRYDSVIVDEFQDTSQLQYAYLLHYFAGQKEVVVVGDDDQTIYSFRGSDIDIILKNFPNDMQPTVYYLTRNFRCGSVILETLKPSIEKNTKRFPKELRAARQGGEVNLYYSVDSKQVTDDIVGYLKKDWSVGIVSRLNDDLITPAIILELEAKVNFAVSKGVSLRKGVPKQVLELMHLLTKRYTDGFGHILKALLPFKAQKQAIALERILKMNPELSIKTIPDADLKSSVPDLYPVLQGLRTFMLSGDLLEGYLFLLRYLASAVYVKDNNRFHAAGREFVAFMTELLTTNPMFKDMDFYDINTLFNVDLPSRLDKRIKYATDTRVYLTTVHEAKGKEWDVAYIWNDVEDVFPTKLSRPLTDDEYEEERRMHYIAGTRAKKVLNIVTRHGKESPFLKECDLSKAGVTYIDEEGLTVEKNKEYMVQRKNTSTSVFTLKKILGMYQEAMNAEFAGTSECTNYAIVANVLSPYDGSMQVIIDDNFGVRLKTIMEQTNLPNATEENVKNALFNELHHVFYTLATDVYNGKVFSTR